MVRNARWVASVLVVMGALGFALPDDASASPSGTASLRPVAVLQGSNVRPGGYFGYVTAVSGGTMAVGAPYVPGGGRVYVFERLKGHWRQTQILKGSNTIAGDVFGVDVKVSGNEMIIGADQASGTGRAYIFSFVGGVWRQTDELPVSGLTPGDHYALSVAISGANAIVSTEDDNKAFIYHNDGSTWTQSAMFTGTGEFGFWVGISGANAVVGADEDGAGLIYVYALAGTKWTQTARLAGTGTAGGDHFGQNLAISGNTIVVNAPYHNSGQGRVYVYTKNGSTWVQSTFVVGSSATRADDFGWYVAISGNTFVAGMPEWQSGGIGTAYVFRGAGSSWRQVAALQATGRTGSDQYGAGVGISGSIAVVGAFGTCKVYVFQI